jgi:hypothetical protein
LGTEAKPFDEVIEEKGVKVLIDPSYLFLLGTEMDYQTSALKSGFTFNNPNQTSACGCGESVQLKQAETATLAPASRISHRTNGGLWPRHHPPIFGGAGVCAMA